MLPPDRWGKTPMSNAATADARLDAAVALEAAGDTAGARCAYLTLLAEAPDHAATLTRLGALLFRTGFRSAARSSFARAAERHPEQPDGHVKLAHLLREDGDPEAARRHYAAALRVAPDLAEAHQGMGNVCLDLGDLPAAERHWRLGYRDHVFATWPYRGAAPPVRVLLLGSVRGGNLPAFPLLDQSVFAVTTVALEYFSVSMDLPPHDVVFNAVGDADLCRRALLAATALLGCTAAPVVNRPDSVLATGRVANAARLAAVPGVVAPRIRLWPRAALLAPGALAEAGFGWPLLLRAPGFHTGRFFVRVDAPEQLASAAAGLPGEAVLAIDYVAPRTADGLSRKYRVMRVDGTLYPLHLAVSRDWKVHYFTAAMAESEAYRAEEAAFLADMPGCLGRRAMAALEGIFGILDLDYAGIDFALTPEGEVVLFEANATMAIVPPNDDPIWDYRRPAIARLVAAARQLVRGRALMV
jgi:tetratricopeptide (TPR) repeat protein